MTARLCRVRNLGATLVSTRTLLRFITRCFRVEIIDKKAEAGTRETRPVRATLTLPVHVLRPMCLLPLLLLQMETKQPGMLSWPRPQVTPQLTLFMDDITCFTPESLLIILRTVILQRLTPTVLIIVIQSGGAMTHFPFRTHFPPTRPETRVVIFEWATLYSLVSLPRSTKGPRPTYVKTRRL